MVEEGQKVRVIANGEVVAKGVILARDERKLSPQDDEIQVLLDT